MTAPFTLRELVAVNLRYDAGSAALNVRAVAQLLAKVLYAEGRLVSLSSNELQQKAARALNIGGIALALVKEGLASLQAIHLARESSGRWLLTDKGYSVIEKDVEGTKKAHEWVLNRHFPGRIECTKLEAWFLDACVEFYCIYGNQWAAALARRAPKKIVTQSSLGPLLEPVCKRHGLGGELDALEAGFRQFVLSDDQEDADIQWSLGHALLASQLVAANVGPDPITSRDFHNSLLILDTNVLIVAALEQHSLAPHLKGLTLALQQINATVGRTEDTREEYTRAVAHRKNEGLIAAENYSLEVLRESTDSFLRTALLRGCVKRQDFEAFYDEILDVPDKLGQNLRISVLNTPDACRMIDRGKADTKLQGQISEAWQSQRGWIKPRATLAHDASLTTLAEGLRTQGQKCAVLTLDRTMSGVAADRAGPNENPSWLLLDGLIQILAVDGAGPGLNPAEIAPLMASIIREQVQPALRTYTAADLAFILDIEHRCAQLPVERVREIASMVARERYRGTVSSNQELQLSIHRAFQGEKMTLEHDLQHSAGIIRRQEVELVKQQGRIRATSGEFIKVRAQQLREDADARLLRFGGPALIVAVVLAYLGYEFTVMLTGTAPLRDFLATLVLLESPAVAVFGWIGRKVIPRWWYERSTANADAEAEANAIGDRGENEPRIP